MARLPGHGLSALLASFLLLASCGGGGGGGGGGAPDDEVPRAYEEPRATATVTSLLSMEATGVTGDVTVTDRAGRATLISADGVTALRDYNAGDLPGLVVSAQPDDLECVLEESTSWAMPDHAGVLALTCAPALVDDGVGVYVERQLVTLVPTRQGLADATLQGHIDGSTTVELRLIKGVLMFVMPALTNGPHDLIFSLGGRDYSHTFNTQNPADIEDVRAWLADYQARLLAHLTDVKAALPESRHTAFDAAVGDIEDSFDALSAQPDAEALEAARWLQANDPLEDAATSRMRPRTADPGFAVCTVAMGKLIARKFAFIEAIKSAGVAGVLGVAAAGTLGVAAAPVAAILGAGAFLGFGVTDGLVASIDTVMQVCVTRRVEFASANLESRIASRSATPPATTTAKRINLLHGVTRSSTVRVRVEPDPAVISLVRSLQQMLAPVSGALSDEITNALYTADTVRYENFDAGSLVIGAFSSPGVPISRSMSQGASSVSFTFSFAGTPPTDPQPFSLTLSGTSEGVPLSVPVRGVLVGGPPLAYDTTEAVNVDTPLKNAYMQADHAESFTMLAQPRHGTLLIEDSETGRYTYTPTAGYEGEDTFTFQANNVAGSSLTGTVTLVVAPFCQLTDLGGGAAQEYCEYPSPDGAEAFVATARSYQNGIATSLQYRFEPDPTEEAPVRLITTWTVHYSPDEYPDETTMTTHHETVIYTTAGPDTSYPVEESAELIIGGAYFYISTNYATWQESSLQALTPGSHLGQPGAYSHSIFWRGLIARPEGEPAADSDSPRVSVMGTFRPDSILSGGTETNLYSQPAPLALAPTLTQVKAITPLDFSRDIDKPFSELYELMRDYH